MSEEAAPFMSLAVDLVRRFLPEADQRTLSAAAIWLVGQCSIFVRNREQLAAPPLNLALDEPAVERRGGRPLGDRGSGPAGVSGDAHKIPAGCRKDSLFRAGARPERVFEIQSTV